MYSDFEYPLQASELLNPAWCRDFLRVEPEIVSPECDPNYLLNQAEANTYFKNYLIQTNDIATSFMKMLLSQHKIACLGYIGDRKYKIKGFCETLKEGRDNWCERESFAGYNRFMLEEKNIDHPAIDIIDIKHDSYSDFLLEEEGIKQNLVWIDNRFIIPNKTTLKIPIILKIENYQLKIEKKIFFFRQGCFYCLQPKSDEYLRFERLVCSNFVELHKKLHEYSFSISIHDLVVLLSNYYHSFINWMPFAFVNNSIVWGQINVILRLCGYKSVPHSKIDMSAMITSTKIFYKVFFEHIIKYQENKKMLKI